MLRRFPVLLAISLVGFSSHVWSQEPLAVKPNATQEASDHASYAVGFNLGTQLQRTGFNDKDFVGADFLKGLMDGLANRKSTLPVAAMQAAEAAIDAKLQARQVEASKRRAVVGQENLTKSQEFLAANKKKDGVQTTKSGLQYIVVAKGQGKTPSLTSEVRVNYEGKLITGEVFDASSRHGGPAEFPVNQVIPGWTEALQRMAVGDKWQLFIPPELAYGLDGPPDIGPNQALIFNIELLDIVK